MSTVSAKNLRLVNSQQINAWEKGQIVPRLAVLANYMDQLGASLYDLADALEIANGRQPRGAQSATTADAERAAARPAQANDTIEILAELVDSYRRSKDPSLAPQRQDATTRSGPLTARNPAR